MRTGLALVLLAALACATGTATAANTLWSFYPGFFSPGKQGIVIADLDDGGRNVAVVSGLVPSAPDSNSFHELLAVLAASGDGFRVTQITLMPESDRIVGPLQRIRRTGHPGDLIAVPVKRTIAALETRILAFYGGTPLAAVDEIVLPASFHMQQVFDVDGDGEAEILGLLVSGVIVRGAPAVLDGATGELLWSDATLSVRFIAAAKLGPASQAIVLASTSPPVGLVLDGSTRQVLWTWPEGFRGYPLIGNFSGSATEQELAFIEPGGYTQLFQTSPTFAPLSGFQTGTIHAGIAVDINDDGLDELVLGKATGGQIVGYSPADWSTVLQLPNPEHGIGALAVGRLSDGPEQHLVFGTGLTSSGTDILRVHEVASGTLKYHAGDEAGPHSSIRLANSGSANPDLVFSTFESNSGYDGGNLIVLDPDTGRERRRRLSVLEPWGFHFGLPVRAGNLDPRTAQDELAIGAAHIYSTTVSVLDSLSLETKWTTHLPLPLAVEELILLDFDGDLDDDVAAAVGGRIHVFDGISGEELWRSDTFEVDGPLTMVSGPLGFAGSHAVALGVGSKLYVMAVDELVVARFHEFPSTVIGQHVETHEGQCLHIVVFEGGLERRDCQTGGLVSAQSLPIAATFVGMPAGSHGPLVVSDGERVHLADNGQVRASSAKLDQDMGWRNRGETFLAGDLIRAYVGGVSGVHLVEFDVGIFRSGFEIEP